LADLERALAIQGWMSPVELAWLAEQASTALLVLELGCWKGRSTRALADNMPNGSVMLAVDTWEGSPSESGSALGAELSARSGAAVHRDFLENMGDHIAAGRVVVIRGDRESAAVSAAPLSGSFDLVFIDADHVRESVELDIAALLPLLKKGGVMAGHDWLRDGVQQAVTAQLRHRPLVVEQIWWVRT